MSRLPWGLHEDSLHHHFLAEPAAGRAVRVGGGMVSPAAWAGVVVLEVLYHLMR
jgi:hypothetical protein